MKTKDFRDEVRDKMKPIAMRYIDTIIYCRGFEKSDVHWEMMESACSFAKGTPYETDEDMGLHMFLHDKSQEITSHLDETIGFSLGNSFGENSKHDIEALGVKLVNELCKLVLTLFPDHDSYSSFKAKEPKPTKLETPPRGMMSCMK